MNIVTAATAVMLLTWSVATADQGPPITSPADKINYAIGVEIARNYRNQGIDLDLDMLIRGMKDVVSNSTIQLSDKEMRNIIISIQSDIRRKRSISKRVNPNGGPSENGASAPATGQQLSKP